MATCPHCKFEFFEYRGQNAPVLSLKDGQVFCHDCASGFIRPYRAEHCVDCYMEKQREDLPIPPTMISTHGEITRENRKRKQRYFREMDMKVVAEKEDDTPKELPTA